MRVAVLLDGGYVRHSIEAAKKAPSVQNILAVAKSALEDEEELFRIYYYDCQEYQGTQVHPLTGDRRVFKRHRKQHESLAYEERVAYRSGYLAWHGWQPRQEALAELIAGTKDRASLSKADFRPVFGQKGVDMRIGLDAAWLALKRIVDKVVLVTADHDFIPAMKLVRREGLAVTIATVGSSRPSSELRRHADFFQNISTDVLT